MNYAGFDTFGFIERINECGSIARIHELVLEEACKFGTRHVLAGKIPREGLPPKQQIEHILFGSWPNEWAHRYFEKNYLDRDPTIVHIRRHTETVRWHELPSGKDWIMQEARAFRLSDGITVPMISANGTRIGISFAGDRISRSGTAAVFFQFVGAIATARALDVARGDPLPDLTPVTPRERSCLLWAAEGKSNREISELLGIAVKTVECHMASCMHKLGGDNRAHMVTRAFRAGLID